MFATPFLQHNSCLLLHFYSTVHGCYSISTAQFMVATPFLSQFMVATPFLQHSSWLLLHFYSTVHVCYSISTAQFMVATPCLGNPDYALENSTIDYSDSGISIRWTPFHRRVRAQQEQRYVWLFAHTLGTYNNSLTGFLSFRISRRPTCTRSWWKLSSCRRIRRGPNGADVSRQQPASIGRMETASSSRSENTRGGGEHYSRISISPTTCRYCLARCWLCC